MSIHENPSTWRLQTSGGIKYKLVNGYPQGTFDEENAEVQERYIIQASDLDGFILESFPPMVLVGDDKFRFQALRPFPGKPTLVTRNIKFKPLDDGLPCDPWGTDSDAPDGTYIQFVLVTVTYTTRKNDPDDPETFLEVSCDAGGEFLICPVKNALFTDSENLPAKGTPEYYTLMNKTQNAPLQYLIPNEEWTVRWTKVDRDFLPTLVLLCRNYLGNVNSETMPLFLNAEKETMLFCGFSFSETFTWRDVEKPPAELEMKFLEKSATINNKQITHNVFWNPDKSEWEKLKMPNGDNVYPDDDLNQLFAW